MYQLVHTSLYVQARTLMYDSTSAPWYTSIMKTYAYTITWQILLKAKEKKIKTNIVIDFKVIVGP